MATIGRLLVDIDANTAKFQKSLSGVDKRLAGFARNMRRITQAAAGVFLSGAFGSAIKETIEQVDQLGKLTDRLGGTVEAFSELEFVAERSGVTFRTLTMGLQRMQRRVAEAAVGTGEAVKALAELGLEAKQITQLSIDQQFEVIADSLAGVASDADKTRLAMKLFDSEGVALLQTMTNGASGIQELRREAQRLGVTLDQDAVDAATRANDALTDLNAAMEAMGRETVSFLTPAIENLTTSLVNLFVEPDLARLEQKLRQTQETMRMLAESGGITGSQFDNLATVVLDTSDKIDELKAKLGDAAFRDGLERLDVSVAVSRANRRLAEMSERFDRIAEAKRRFNEQFKQDKENEQQIRNTHKLMEDSARMLDDSFETVAETAKNSFDEIEQASKQAARNIQDAFADFLFDPFEDGVKGMVKSFLDAIRRMLANQAAVQLFKFIGGLFGGTEAPAGKGSKTGKPDKLTFAGAFAGGGSFTVPGSGGTDSTGVMFRATPGERVTVTKPGQSAGGGVSIVNNIHVDGADPERAAQLIDAAAEQGSARALASFFEMREKGRA